MRGLCCVILVGWMALPAVRAEIVIPGAIVHTPDLVARGPDLTLTRPSDVMWHDAAFFNDGSRFFIVADEPTINVWAVLVYYWPILATLASAWGVWRLLRPLRRAYAFGNARNQPHCSCCDYQLTGSTLPTCPECGVSLNEQPPRLGPPRRMDVIWRAGLSVALIAAVVAMWTLDVPRIGKVSTWFQWNSRSLHARLIPPSFGFGNEWSPFVTEERVLLEYDASTGTQLARHLIGYAQVAGADARDVVIRIMRYRPFGHGEPIWRSTNGRYWGCLVHRSFVVFDCEARSIIARQPVDNRNDSYDETDAIRHRYGLATSESFNTTESVPIEGTQLLCDMSNGWARHAHDDYGETGFLRQGRALLRAAPETDDRLFTWHSHLIVGDLKRSRWIARLDIKPCDTFVSMDMNRNGDYVLARPRDNPDRILLFNLKEELLRLPE